MSQAIFVIFYKFNIFGQNMAKKCKHYNFPMHAIEGNVYFQGFTIATAISLNLYFPLLTYARDFLYKKPYSF